MNKLQELINSGTVRYDSEDMEYIGKASDGTEVSFGSDESQVNKYLENRPNPEQW